MIIFNVIVYYLSTFTSFIESLFELFRNLLTTEHFTFCCFCETTYFFQAIDVTFEISEIMSSVLEMNEKLFISLLEADEERIKLAQRSLTDEAKEEPAA